MSFYSYLIQQITCARSWFSLHFFAIVYTALFGIKWYRINDIVWTFPPGDIIILKYDKNINFVFSPTHINEAVRLAEIRFVSCCRKPLLVVNIFWVFRSNCVTSFHSFRENNSNTTTCVIQAPHLFKRYCNMFFQPLIQYSQSASDGILLDIATIGTKWSVKKRKKKKVNIPHFLSCCLGCFTWTVFDSFSPPRCTRVHSRGPMNKNAMATKRIERKSPLRAVSDFPFLP